MEKLLKEKAQLEARFADLELEKNARQQEADEWQEVAMNTKREGEAAAKRLTLANQELDAQIVTLEATKQAMQREAVVKANAMSNAVAEYEEKLSAAEKEKENIGKKVKDEIEKLLKEKAQLEARAADLELEKDARQQEADEWQEVAMNTKREGEAATKRLSLANQELDAQIVTLEATKQAMQREADVKATAMSNAVAEYEDKFSAAEKEKENVGKKAKDEMEKLLKEKAQLEARVANLELEKNAREQEADEWQEVAMNTKRDAEESARQTGKTIADLQAEIETLEATKAAMQREAEVKAQVMTNLKTDTDETTRILEGDVVVAKKKSESALEEIAKERIETAKRIASLESDKDDFEREAEEWQEVAINTKREGEEKIIEMEQTINRCESEKAALREEIAELKSSMGISH